MGKECLWFQGYEQLVLRLITTSTHCCDSEGANSAEFDSNTEHPVVIFMPEISKTHMGGTMRLGLRPTVFDADSDASGARPSAVRKLYGGAPKIWERHRHR